MLNKKYITIFLVIVVVVLALNFAPKVYKLNSGEISIKRWRKKLGETTEVVNNKSKSWIPLKDISKHIINAIIAAEDSRFYTHYGIDAIEIWTSFKKNIRLKRYARGASTITQQVVKISLLNHEKTIKRKLREVIGALLLEQMFEKNEILEWYINLIEFGNGIYGIKEACNYYFNTRPEQLKISQAIHLALVLPSPNKWNKGLKQKNLTTFGHQRFAYILDRMLNMRFITKEQWLTTYATGNFGRPIRGYYQILPISKDQLIDFSPNENSYE